MSAMKKIFVFTILLGTMLLVPSCVQPLDDTMKTSLEGAFGIDLSVVCTVPGTKAEKPGVDALNENVVSYVDWFIFESDADTESAVLHGSVGRENEEAIVQAVTDGVLQTRDIKLKGPISMDDLVSAYGNSFYVYAIANLPETYTHDALKAKKLGELKALSLVAGFNINPFKAQDNFVMHGGQSFMFQETDKNKVKKVTVDLKRIAAKVTINMNVAPAIDQMTTLPTGGLKYEKTWYPILDDMQVYMSFANAESTVKGDPIAYDQNKFFTYNRDAFTPTVSPATSTTPDWNDVSWKWNVTGTPFYSYPMSWSSDSPQAPFLKVILKWRSYKEDESPVYDDNGKLIRATSRTPDPSQMIEAGKEFFYKIPIPGEVLNSNEWYHLTFDVDILGSTADELPVNLGGQYCVVDWSTSNVKAGGELKQGSYLSVYSDTYYIYGEDYIDIPVLSSHNITTTVTSATYYDYSSTSGAQPRTLSSSQYSVTDNGRTSFRLSHTLNSDLAGTDVDVSYITYTITISNGISPSKTITVIQYPPLYIEPKRSNGYVFINGSYSYDRGNAINAYSDYYYGSGYNRTRDFLGSVSGLRNVTGSGENSNPYQYNIHVSALGSNSDLIIGDPRGAVKNWPGLSLNGAYLPSQRTGVSNMVSPFFKISSAYSKTVEPIFDYDLVEERCAAFQENGYPAGRWRVPTEGEILFAVTLSDLGKIPSLFMGCPYWASSGRLYNPSTKTFIEASSSAAQRDNGVRCVYDVWYWGDNQMNLTQWNGYND